MFLCYCGKLFQHIYKSLIMNFFAVLQIYVKCYPSTNVDGLLRVTEANEVPISSHVGRFVEIQNTFF